MLNKKCAQTSTLQFKQMTIKKYDRLIIVRNISKNKCKKFFTLSLEKGKTVN